VCDRCPRVMCTKHITPPPGLDINGMLFVCVACHIRVNEKAAPYIVSPLRPH
jgi:hypothetical protein